jgi:hypothetical protein
MLHRKNCIAVKCLINVFEDFIIATVCTDCFVHCYMERMMLDIEGLEVLNDELHSEVH